MAARGYFVRPVDGAGRTHNAAVLGAVVTVFVAGTTTIVGGGAQTVDGGGGYCAGQRDGDVYVALADAGALVDIEVRFPGGTGADRVIDKALGVKPGDDFAAVAGRRVYIATRTPGPTPVNILQRTFLD